MIKQASVDKNHEYAELATLLCCVLPFGVSFIAWEARSMKWKHGNVEICSVLESANLVIFYPKAMFYEAHIFRDVRF